MATTRPKPCRTFTEAQLADAMLNDCGFCLDCGAEQAGVEPDARRYRCDECGALEVYGADEIALSGRMA